MQSGGGRGGAFLNAHTGEKKSLISQQVLRSEKDVNFPPRSNNKSPQTYLPLQVQDKNRRRRHVGGEKCSARGSPADIRVYCQIWVTRKEQRSLSSSSFLLVSVYRRWCATRCFSGATSQASRRRDHVPFPAGSRCLLAVGLFCSSGGWLL